MGNFAKSQLSYDLLNKEEESRNIIFNMALIEEKLNFFDVGGKDGKLSYLLGDKGNFTDNEEFYHQNKLLFDERYHYFGLDINPAGENILFGDICHRDFLISYADKKHFFDVIYSNNVFEHLQKPWVAAENINHLLKEGGVVIMIAPFSLRYHACPDDYFRYTHTAFYNLFSDFGNYEVLKTGYDIQGRRNNWQGSGEFMDIVPVDNFGAWREAWITFTALKKID